MQQRKSWEILSEVSLDIIHQSCHNKKHSYSGRDHGAEPREYQQIVT